MENAQKVLEGSIVIMMVLMLKFYSHTSGKIQNYIFLFIHIIWYKSFQLLFK